MIGIKFDKAIKSLVLIMLKVTGYVNTFKVKDGDKNKDNKLMSFRIDDKLLEQYKTISTKIENLQNNTLPVYDNRYIKTKIRIYGDKVYATFVAKMCQKMI